MKDIKLLPVAIGTHVDIRELEKITNNKLDIIHFGESEKPETVCKRIWHGKEMKSCKPAMLYQWEGLFLMLVGYAGKSLWEGLEGALES